MKQLPKIWSQPILLSLLRSKTEEVVLSGCKTGLSTGGPLNSNSSCSHPCGQTCDANL